MKIQFVSDLHLEFAANRTYLKEHPLGVTGDILLVAGDSAYLDLPESGQVVSIDDIDIIVSTLWSIIEPFNAYQTEKGVSDFYRIMYNGHRLTADDFNAEHERCFNFVRKAVNESKAKTKIVLTHHVPTQLCIAAEFVGSTINGAFTVELGKYIADSDIDYWIYGHSHRNIDAQIGDTQILSNQLGYTSHGEHLRNGFNPSRYIEI